MSAASMAALNTSFAGQRLNKTAARKVSAKRHHPRCQAGDPRSGRRRARGRLLRDRHGLRQHHPLPRDRRHQQVQLRPPRSSHGLRPHGLRDLPRGDDAQPQDHYQWFNRDRFVLSAGHGCMLQYSLMHLTGYPSVSVRVVFPATHVRFLRALKPRRRRARTNPSAFREPTAIGVLSTLPCSGVGNRAFQRVVVATRYPDPVRRRSNRIGSVAPVASARLRGTRAS